MHVSPLRGRVRSATTVRLLYMSWPPPRISLADGDRSAVRKEDLVYEPG
jgi:hypothetical protein